MHPALNSNHTAPKTANLHLFSSQGRRFGLDVEYGRIFEVNESIAQAMETAIKLGDTQGAELMGLVMGVSPQPLTGIDPPKSVPVKALSLAIAQKCNLGCTYCYAEQGTFGGLPNNMDLQIAQASVDTLLASVSPGEKITLAFMGGEPLFNRSTLHAVTEYAVEKATIAQIGVAFSITTNATLIRPEDIALFQKYNFTVTVSIDGLKEANDALRPFISGKGSFKNLEEKLKLLVNTPQRKFMVLARVTVTPKNLGLTETMQGLLDMGFDSVKFSPMLKSPTGKEEMQAKDFDTLLEQMINCGELFRAGLAQGKLYPVSNIISTLKRIHNFQREQYPCGAGGGYMGVSSQGELYACHRFVNDEAGHMGNVKTGVDPQKQGQWLEDRHLSSQGACNTCWARYMCSGSCHHEVINRGRPACDYIRGWLHYCLGLYTDLLDTNPELLKGILGDTEKPFLETSNRYEDAGL